MGATGRDFELSDEPVNAGADPGPGRWTTPPIGTLPAAADPLHVEGDPDPVATRPALPVLDDAARSPDPSVCPFLRRDVDGSLAAPGSEPADDHACVAIGGPRPQSQRQQELVCLRVAHADCPRYLRGALALAPTPRRAAPAVPRATLAALLILVLSAGLSFGFVVQRGGITMPVVGGTPAPTAIAAVVTASPVASQLATVAPTASTPSATHAPTSAPTAAPTLAPTPSPTVAPTPAPTAEPTVTPTPSPTPRPTATPTSTRYKLLTPCPDRKNCYIYTVRSGDNLYSIAHYFGHPLSVIYAWNPQYPARHLRVGDQIRMPPPTR